MHRWLTFGLLFLQPTALMSQDRAKEPEPGISAELADHRTKTVGQIAYDLSFDLAKGKDTVEGSATIYFSLARVDEPFVLDFGGIEIAEVKLNGEAVEQNQLKRVHDHIVVHSPKARTRNELDLKFRSKVAATGSPLNIYKDSTDGSEYLYTLVVPADAHRLFPCFDQPDLKAIFNLTLTVPADWVAVANEPLASTAEKLRDGRVKHVFRSTLPLPTYLFAFAAGPFAVVDGPVVDFSPQKLPDSAHPLRIYVRRSKQARLEKDKLFRMHLDSVRWYEKYFAYRYPFSKLDMVLCPGFPYGGMEHAGAIFYRESALVFDHEPTEVELMGRSSLIYHEVAHQWFGNLVTMHWFDDLWLKEGFATFMGYSVLDVLEPERRAWLRFHQRVKPAAYRIDSTLGTVPVYQSLANMNDAKSNYGPIVYNKAPAVLRELEQRIGPATFQKGVQVFLQQYAFRNARWRELLGSFEMAKSGKLDAWSEKWILSAGMPKLRAVFETKDGAITSFGVRQSSATGMPTSAWPIRVTVLADDPAGKPHRVQVSCDSAFTPVPSLIGKNAPRWVLLNPDDVAYGLFLLDPRTTAALPGLLTDPKGRLEDPLTRAVAFRSLFEMVREAETSPLQLIEVAYELLADERDPLTFASLLGAARYALERWTSGPQQRTWRTRIETRLRDMLAGEKCSGLELQVFRALASLGRDTETLDLCSGLLDGSRPIKGLQLGPRDRFLAGATLLAAGREDALGILDSLRGKAKGDVAKHHYQALAAAPDSKIKESYFENYGKIDEPPEQWISGSLSFFHWPGQEAMTLPYLERALAKLEWVKANRKIFFMPAWIDSFLGAHGSAEALAIVDRFLGQRRDLPQDIRRKLLQSVDGLRRAVRIREKFFPE